MTTLILNKEQAIVLSIILAHVGGSPTKSGRKYSDEISRLLREQDVLYGDKDLEKYVVREPDENAAGIWFEETK